LDWVQFVGKKEKKRVRGGGFIVFFVAWEKKPCLTLTCWGKRGGSRKGCRRIKLDRRPALREGDACRFHWAKGERRKGFEEGGSGSIRPVSSFSEKGEGSAALLYLLWWEGGGGKNEGTKKKGGGKDYMIRTGGKANETITSISVGPEWKKKDR